MFDDDLEQLNAGLLLYDAFYRRYRDATTEMHNWPTNKVKVTELAATQKVGAQEPARGISFNEALSSGSGWPSRATAAQPARSL